MWLDISRADCLPSPRPDCRTNPRSDSSADTQRNARADSDRDTDRRAYPEAAAECNPHRNLFEHMGTMGPATLSRKRHYGYGHLAQPDGR